MKLEHMKQNKARSIEGWGGVGESQVEYPTLKVGGIQCLTRKN